MTIILMVMMTMPTTLTTTTTKDADNDDDDDDDVHKVDNGRQKGETLKKHQESIFFLFN